MRASQRVYSTLKGISSSHLLTMATTVNIAFTFVLHPVEFEIVARNYAVLVRPRFSGLFIKFGKASILLFKSGRANLTGVRSEDEALCIMNKFCTKLETSIIFYKIVNLTATSRLRFNFEKLKRHPEAEYEPELFPAIYFRKGKEVTAVFHSGKIIMTGIKSEIRVNDKFIEIKSMIEDF